MNATQGAQVVTFRLGPEHFAADILAVERVLRYAAPTAVPRLPDWVDGVLDYEDRVVPVIDLRRRFGIAAEAPRPENRIIIFAVADQWVGAVVDAVHDVVALGAEQMAPPPPLFRGLPAEYLRGLVRRDGRMVICLEVQRLLTSTEALQLAQAMETRDG